MDRSGERMGDQFPSYIFNLKAGIILLATRATFWFLGLPTWLKLATDRVGSWFRIGFEIDKTCGEGAGGPKPRYYMYERVPSAHATVMNEKTTLTELTVLYFVDWALTYRISSCQVVQPKIHIFTSDCCNPRPTRIDF
jgi:hypothetical protein